MNKRQLRKYLNGWKEVAKLEEKELRNTPSRVKFRQILSVFKLGVGLGLAKKQTTDKQTIEVRNRWCLLKAGH